MRVVTSVYNAGMPTDSYSLSITDYYLVQFTISLYYGNLCEFDEKCTQLELWTMCTLTKLSLVCTRNSSDYVQPRIESTTPLNDLTYTHATEMSWLSWYIFAHAYMPTNRIHSHRERESQKRCKNGDEGTRECVLSLKQLHKNDYSVELLDCVCSAVAYDKNSVRWPSERTFCCEWFH